MLLSIPRGKVSYVELQDVTVNTMEDIDQLREAITSHFLSQDLDQLNIHICPRHACVDQILTTHGVGSKNLVGAAEEGIRRRLWPIQYTLGGDRFTMEICWSEEINWERILMQLRRRNTKLPPSKYQIHYITRLGSD